MTRSSGAKLVKKVVIFNDLDNLPGIQSQIEHIRKQVDPEGKVTRTLAHRILIQLGDYSEQQARERLDEYLKSSKAAFQQGRRKKIDKQLREMDWSFAVADTFMCAEYRSQGLHRDSKERWSLLTQTTVDRILPCLKEVPYGGYKAAEKEVVAFCDAQNHAQRADFEKTIEPFALASVAYKLGDADPFERSREFLFKAHCALKSEAAALAGPPYNTIPLRLFASASKRGTEPRSPSAPIGSGLKLEPGFLGPTFIEGLRAKIWEYFTPSIAQTIISQQSISQWQAAKLRYVRHCDNQKKTSHFVRVLR